MSRHPNQTNGYNRPLGPTNPTPRTPHAAALIARSRGKSLEQLAAELPKAPPHVCDYGQASKRCRRCGREEVVT